MAEKLDNIHKQLKELEVSEQQRVRVVVYGDDWNDEATSLGMGIREWFRNNGLEGQSAVDVCKLRVSVEKAFYGQYESTDPVIIPSLVMAGKYIRHYAGGHIGMTDEFNVEVVQKLCAENGVPMVRYSFNKKKDRFELLSPLNSLKTRSSR